MRIAISGSANLGKSTLIKDFLEEWPTYGFEVKTYREGLEVDFVLEMWEKEKNRYYILYSNDKT